MAILVCAPSTHSLGGGRCARRVPDRVIARRHNGAMTDATNTDPTRPLPPTSELSAPLDDFDLLGDVDPAEAPEIADRLAADLAARREAGRAEEERGG